MPSTPLTILVALFGVAIIAASSFGMIAPKRLCRIVNSAWKHPSLLWFAVGVRLALGAMLIAVAEETSFPLAFQCLGYIAIAAAVLIPFIGHGRIGRLLAFFERCPVWMVRLWLCLGLAFGGFMIYGVL